MLHEVVICTKDRPGELIRCLESLRSQTCQPTRVVVVESSSVLTDLSGTLSVPLLHRASAPGLTLQRNLGLGELHRSTEVVHFLDDDVVLDEDYLAEILDGFGRHPLAGGIGGRISNLPEHAPSWPRRVFLLDTVQHGVLLQSGVNVMAFSGGHDRRVDWLSGCSMSFRVNSISDLRFDERRTGNGFGEDVDFTARLAARAPLVWCPTAVLEHRQSAVNRDEASFIAKRSVRHRWRLAQDRVGGVRRRCVVYAIVGEIAILLAKGLRHRSRSTIQQAWSLLQELVLQVVGR